MQAIGDQEEQQRQPWIMHTQERRHWQKVNRHTLREKADTDDDRLLAHQPLGRAGDKELG